MKWYEIHDNFVLLYRYLRAVENYHDDQLENVVARPWRWEREYHAARRWAASRDLTPAVREKDVV